MNEETLNTSTRKFLKLVGAQSQQAIEQAIQSALNAGRIKGTESFPVTARLNIEELDLSIDFDGRIHLK
jgi:hypothetical protein